MPEIIFGTINYMIDPRFNGFFLLTGVTFAAFASGFGVCLFNLDEVDACLAVANNWVDILKGIGDRIVEWGVAMGRGAFRS